jgi:hypothetical protein
MLMSPFDLRRASRVSNLTVQFAQDDFLTQHRKARTSITASDLSDPYNAPLHFHPQSLCNGDPEADMRAFLRTGARKHKDPELAKVITASFPLFVNTVCICPPEDDRHVQRETLRFAALGSAVSSVLNHGFRLANPSKCATQTSHSIYARFCRDARCRMSSDGKDSCLNTSGRAQRKKRDICWWVRRSSSYF